jgi:RHS repeat-associated protein
MQAAAKENSSAPPAGLLANLTQNSHPAHQLPTAALYPASNLAIPLSLIGISTSVYDSRVGPRCSSKERDAETGLDFFGARYMSSAQGRFTSPDEPFADQDPADPQSWNLYGYVRNNPLKFTDPTGRDCIYTNTFDERAGTVQVETGSCSQKGGTYVAGTIDPKSLTYDRNSNSLDYGYKAYKGGVESAGSTNLPNLDAGILALQRGTQLAEPGVNLAGQGLVLFASIIAPGATTLAQCVAGSCDSASLAMAAVRLPKGATKVLGTLAPLAEKTVAEAVKLRGGGGAQVNKIATWLQQMSLGDVAKLAAEGNREAVSAVKIVKDAARLSKK